jgi:hypothetical protein
MKLELLELVYESLSIFGFSVVVRRENEGRNKTLPHTHGVSVRISSIHQVLLKQLAINTTIAR